VAAAIGGIFYIVMFDRVEEFVQEREREELGIDEAEQPNAQT
jgi:hypothetical protein